jgi:hypothetical protein
MGNIWFSTIAYHRLEDRVRARYRVRIARRRALYALQDFGTGMRDGIRPWIPLLTSVWIAALFLLLLRYVSLWLAAFSG